jgi:hypothetical protein
MTGFIRKSHEIGYCNVEFEVLTVVVVKSSVLWDITPYFLPALCLFHANFLLGLCPNTEDECDFFL